MLMASNFKYFKDVIRHNIKHMSVGTKYHQH